MISVLCTLSLSFFSLVELDGSVLRLGHVADLSALPADLAQHAADTALLRIEPSIPRTTVSRRELAAHAAAKLPILAGCFLSTGPDPIVIRRKVAPGAPRATGADPTGIVRGERVTVQIASGPFSIERTGIAADAAGPGQRLFVRTGDGRVVRAVAAEGPTP